MEAPLYKRLLTINVPGDLQEVARSALAVLSNERIRDVSAPWIIKDAQERADLYKFRVHGLIARGGCAPLGHSETVEQWEHWQGLELWDMSVQSESHVVDLSFGPDEILVGCLIFPRSRRAP